MLYLISLCAILALFVYFRVTWNNNYWRKKKVPYETPGFFFGSFKDAIMGRRHFGIVYAELYEKSKHLPYYGFFKVTEPTIIVNDLELIKTVLIKDFDHFANNDFQVNEEVDRLWSTSLFVQTGEKWKKSRNAWTHSMTTNKIKTAYQSLNDKSEIMIDHIKNHIENHPDTPMESRKLATKLFTDGLVQSVFGWEINSFDEPDNIFLKIAQSLYSFTMWDASVMVFFMMAPKIGKMLRLRLMPKQIYNHLLVLAKEILEHRKRNGFHKNNPMDSIILHGESGEEVTDLDIAGVLFNFLLDGTETSSGVAAYMLHEIAINLDVQNKLRTEIDAAVKENGGKLEYEMLHKLSYLDMVFSETMRLHPGLMTLQRMCTKKYVLPPISKNDPPVEIPVGMSVIIPIYAMQRDPEYFPDPMKFDPERFNKENKEKIPKFAYVPFGEGPRLCIGERFAVNQIKIFIAQLIKNFEIRLAPIMKEKILTVDPKVVVNRNSGGFWINLHTR